jgi:hypothetical protein
MATAAQQYLFVSNRNIVLGSIMGHSIEFRKGVPTHVPRSMHSEVLEKGIIRCDAKGAPLDEEATAATLPEPKAANEAPEEASDRADAILAVIKRVVERNNSKDFSAGGVPLAAVVTAQLGWRVDQTEIRPIWNKYKPEMLAKGK